MYVIRRVPAASHMRLGWVGGMHFLVIHYTANIVLVLYLSHAATSWGHPTLLEYLLNHGGDANVCDNDGDTPMHVCEQYVA